MYEICDKIKGDIYGFLGIASDYLKEVFLNQPAPSWIIIA
jgi:hypothetical protein